MAKKNPKQHEQGVLNSLLSAPPSEQGRRNPFWNLSTEQLAEMDRVKEAYQLGDLRHLTFSAIFRECKPLLGLRCCLGTFKSYMERE
jgi:hypothetical protein